MAIFLFFFFLIADQVTKIWAATTEVSMPVIGEWLRFEYIQNPGAAFSLFGDKEWSRVFFIVVSTVAIVVFFVLYAACKNKVLKNGLMLLASGALGNLIDRTCALLQDLGVPGITGFETGVRDFIWPTFFANFNVADIAVCVGVGLIILYLLFLSEDSIFGGVFKKKKPQTEQISKAEESSPSSAQAKTKASSAQAKVAPPAQAEQSTEWKKRAQSLPQGEDE